MTIDVRRATIEDIGFVREVMTAPDIYERITDDGCPGPEDFDPTPALKGEAFVFLIPHECGSPMGVFLFHPWNTICYEQHSCILPEYRGRAAVQAAMAAQRYMFDNTPCTKIVGHVPVNNLPAYAFAYRIGMRKEGVNRASFLKNGKAIDQYIVGIIKE